MSDSPLNPVPIARARVVLLSGPSGSGKSSLAERSALPVLQLDDFYKDGDDPTLPLLPDGAVDWDSPLSWHREQAVAAIRDLYGTGRAEVPVYSIPDNGRIATRVLDLDGAGAFVAEGIFAAEIVGECAAEGLLGDALCLAAERLGTTTVAVSRQVAQTLHGWGVPPGRVELIPNGIDADRYRRQDADRAATRARLRAELGLPPGSWVVGGVGRLVPGKRFPVLLEALAELDGAARLVLVGEGPERAALERRAAELGVRDRLVLTGERDDVPDLLTALDVLAAPSTEETFGLGVLEGLAAGLPVRHSACPALDELPPSAAPQARRIPSDAAAYATALGELRHLNDHSTDPLPRPPAVGHYDIVRVAADLGALYDRLVPA
ncbi:glycosyltransferase [Kitasatospora sp. NPDC001574]